MGNRISKTWTSFPAKNKVWILYQKLHRWVIFGHLFHAPSLWSFSFLPKITQKKKNKVFLSFFITFLIKQVWILYVDPIRGEHHPHFHIWNLILRACSETTLNFAVCRNHGALFPNTWKRESACIFCSKSNKYDTYLSDLKTMDFFLSKLFLGISLYNAIK